MSNGPYEAVQALVSELTRQDALIVAYAKRGLTANEVRESVARIAPELLHLVDDTVTAWWSWHNGIDNSKPRPLAPERYKHIDNVSPGTLMLWPLDAILRRYIDLLDSTRELIPDFRVPRDTFPLNYDDGNALISLCREDPSGPWSIWALERDGDDWEPLETRAGEPNPTFVEYLDDITAGLIEGQLTTRYGGVDV